MTQQTELIDNTPASYKWFARINNALEIFTMALAGGAVLIIALEVIFSAVMLAMFLIKVLS